VTSGEEEDPTALTALAEIETARSFEVREGLGSNLKTKCRSEGNAYVDCWIDGEDVVEELLSCVPGVDRLTERNLDVGDRILQEEVLAARGRAFGLVEEERAGQYAHPQEEGTRFLFGFGKADGVDARPLELDRVEELVDFLAELVPHARDRVDAERAGLLGDALSLRATREWPGGAGVVDGKGVGRETKEVVVGLV